MTTRAQKVRLGVFILVALALLLVALVTLAGMKLFDKRDRYLVRFRSSVSGLEAGSTVKMKGVRVGQVESIAIDDDVETVVVKLALNPGTPVKTDTRAVITAIGITGLKFIELTGGSARAPRIPPNRKDSLIPAGEDAISSLTGKATDIARKMEAVLNNVLEITGGENRGRIRRVLDDVSKLAEAWTAVATDNREPLARLLRRSDRLVGGLEKTAATLDRLVRDNAPGLTATIAAAESAAAAIARLARGIKVQRAIDEVGGAARAVRKRIDDPAIGGALRAIGAATQRVARLLADLGTVVRRRDRQLGAILGKLDRAALDFARFARAIRERPSLLLRGETVRERKIP